MKKQKTPLLVSVAGSIEWLAVALVFAFVFRGFIVEAFKIPTGSMAPTLRGDHFEVACTQCGYEYDVNHTPGNKQIFQIDFRCPSCGNHQKLFVEPTGGDRILVYKGLYHFNDPKRWDVFVFKNPTEPHINYIKRCVGLPGETLELIDGDVFIDGNIARKPSKVQEELWLPVYDGDHIPARTSSRSFNNAQRWSVPFETADGWKYEDDGATFILNSDETAGLSYNTTIGNNFQATYAYNPPAWYKYQEYCSDLRVKFWVKDINNQSHIGASISKYGRTYTGKVDFTTAKMQLFSQYKDETALIAEKDISDNYPTSPVEFEFNNADYRLTLAFGKYELKADIGQAHGDIGTHIEGGAALSIAGAGKLEINHISIDRDIHYVSRQMMNTDDIRGGEGNPVTLSEDEFFACGDNSPQSLDSRLWTDPGIGNSGLEYPLGVVPRDYLIGQAFYVYWPGSYKTKPRGKSISFIPNIGMMRWIYGGENEVE